MHNIEHFLEIINIVLWILIRGRLCELGWLHPQELMDFGSIWNILSTSSPPVYLCIHCLAKVWMARRSSECEMYSWGGCSAKVAKPIGPCGLVCLGWFSFCSAGHPLPLVCLVSILWGMIANYNLQHARTHELEQTIIDLNSIAWT